MTDIQRRDHPARRSLPLAEWPEADRSAWEAALAPGDILDGTVGAPITLSVTFRDCTGANAGHCVETDGVLQLTPA